MGRRRGGLNFSRRHKKFNMVLLKEIFAWAAEITAVVAIAVVVTYIFGFRTNVVGNAMEPTLINGEQVLINRMRYAVSRPKQGDVVVFLPNGNEKSHYYIRRVIAVPGDKVYIQDGAVYVNGEKYDEKVEVSAAEDPGIAAEELTLGNDEYFVLGDNRNSSEDSRYANIGMVKKKYIAGKAWFHFSGGHGSGFVR